MSSSPSRIGIYGGSFDPVHLGHLILANDAAEMLDLDRVIFLPAGRNPHKQADPLSSADQRLRLLKIAIQENPRFVADRRELDRPAPSFTIDSVRELNAEHPGARLFLFIGGDQLAKLDQWREIDVLHELVDWVVFNRLDGDGPLPEGATVIPRRMDISSTEVRNRVAKGLSLDYFLQNDVVRLIEKENLYRSH